jgi:hypothetical protein
MNHSKPKQVGPVMPDCPVCGKTTYSRGGIHPQCASERADKIARAARVENAANAETVATAAEPRQQWTKQCVRCRQVVPARRAVCDCGFTFMKMTI